MSSSSFTFDYLCRHHHHHHHHHRHHHHHHHRRHHHHCDYQVKFAGKDEAEEYCDGELWKDISKVLDNIALNNSTLKSKRWWWCWWWCWWLWCWWWWWWCDIVPKRIICKKNSGSGSGRRIWCRWKYVSSSLFVMESQNCTFARNSVFTWERQKNMTKLINLTENLPKKRQYLQKLGVVGSTCEWQKNMM